MALEKCPECGGQVSTKARFCPHCGAQRMPKGAVVIALIALVVLIGLVGVGFALFMATLHH